MGEWSDYFEDFPEENPANYDERGRFIHPDGRSNGYELHWDDTHISWEFAKRFNKFLPNPPRRPTEKQIQHFCSEVEVAQEYRQSTGHYPDNMGHLGELYAALMYGIKLHRPCAEGSDGKLGNDYVEVKTITPSKKKHRVAVKRAGHFSKLIVVKIDENFHFESRFVDRGMLHRGPGRMATLSWSRLPSAYDEPLTTLAKRS